MLVFTMLFLAHLLTVVSAYVFELEVFSPNYPQVHEKLVKLSNDEKLTIGEGKPVKVDFDRGTARVEDTEHYLCVLQDFLHPSPVNIPLWTVDNAQVRFDNLHTFIVCLSDNYNIYFAGSETPCSCSSPVPVALQIHVTSD